MTQLQIQNVAVLFNSAIGLGMTIIGGVKALAGLFGHVPTDEELNAIEDAIQADASRREAERRAMAGDKS